MPRAARPGFGKRISPLGQLDSKAAVESLPLGPETDVLKWLREEIRDKPRKDEGAIIARIEQASQDVITTLFEEADLAMERFYESVRIPVAQEEEGIGHGLPVKGPDGGFVWETNEYGRPKEDWSRLDGMDVEATIGVLQRVILHAADEVAKLYGRVYFAQEVYQDEYWAGYRGGYGGTVGDHTASAREASRDSRYYAMYLWWVHDRASKRLEEYRSLMRSAEFQRNRFIRDPERARAEYGRRSE